MGSRWWFETHPWTGSVESTLEAAQVRFLASDAMLEALPRREDMVATVEMMLDAPFLPMPDEARAAMRGALDRLSPDGRPATRADAMLLTMEMRGTGTILDVSGVDPIDRAPDEVPPANGWTAIASPLPPEWRERACGSAEPTMAAIEDSEASMMALAISRDDARYIIAYENGTPSGVVFFGLTGD